jgi:hypothetical protein
MLSLIQCTSVSTKLSKIIKKFCPFSIIFLRCDRKGDKNVRKMEMSRELKIWRDIERGGETEIDEGIKITR